MLPIIFSKGPKPTTFGLNFWDTLGDFHIVIHILNLNVIQAKTLKHKIYILNLKVEGKQLI